MPDQPSEGAGRPRPQGIRRRLVDHPPRPRLTKRKGEIERWADTRALIERLKDEVQTAQELEKLFKR
jgi:hypothetical protein